jgi:CDP-diacylglycerol--serine O-phosphatidyltransferase
MMLKQFLNPPNWFTSASLFCGLYAILLAGGANAGDEHFYKAGLMIFFAGLFDMLDGRVARMTGTGTAFGVQLDSLVDIISFGVAPACLVYFWGLQDLMIDGSSGAESVPGVFIAGMLMLCGAFRLARFNVTADGKAHAFSQGLTITMGGGTVSSVVMWFAGGHYPPPPPSVIVALVVTIALLEVSSVPYRTMKSFRMSPRTMAAIVVFAGVCLAVGAVYDISTVLVLLGLAHVASGPVEMALGFPRRRRERRQTRAEQRSQEPSDPPHDPRGPE